MLDTTNTDQFDPTQSGVIADFEAQFGLNDKHCEFSKASSFGLDLDDDPWAELKASSAEANANASTDELTGEETGATRGFNSGGNVIQGGNTTNAEKNEVADLLNNSQYNRDAVTGTRTFFNNEWTSLFSTPSIRHSSSTEKESVSEW